MNQDRCINNNSTAVVLPARDIPYSMLPTVLLHASSPSDTQRTIEQRELQSLSFCERLLCKV